MTTHEILTRLAADELTIKAAEKMLDRVPEWCQGPYLAVLDTVVHDRTQSYWLKHAAHELNYRDVVDAVEDAKTLHHLMQLRHREVLAKATEPQDPLETDR